MESFTYYPHTKDTEHERRCILCSDTQERRSICSSCEDVYKPVYGKRPVRLLGGLRCM